MIFEKMASKDVNIDMISQTAPSHGYVNISFTAPENERYVIEEILEEIKKELPEIEIDMETNITKLSVVGIGMRSQSGVAAKMFKIFAENGIAFKQVTTSEIRISYTIDTRDKEKAIVAIAREFNL
jgi:aspartate kinase